MCDDMLLYVSDPSERILDLSLLDAYDVVVKLEGLRTAFSVTVSVNGLFLRLKERLVNELVYWGDHHCCAAFSDFLELCELRYRYWSSLYLHAQVSCNCLERLVGN